MLPWYLLLLLLWKSLAYLSILQDGHFPWGHYAENEFCTCGLKTFSHMDLHISWGCKHTMTASFNQSGGIYSLYFCHHQALWTWVLLISWKSPAESGEFSLLYVRAAHNVGYRLMTIGYKVSIRVFSFAISIMRKKITTAGHWCLYSITVVSTWSSSHLIIYREKRIWNFI